MGQSLSDVLAETLASLEMPREGLLLWIEHNLRFCERHGGGKRYREWIELYERCRAALEDGDAP